jgi:hypothetical protein
MRICLSAEPLRKTLTLLGHGGANPSGGVLIRTTPTNHHLTEASLAEVFDRERRHLCEGFGGG